MNRILITGAAGFIGHAFAKRLLEVGVEVLGIDNLNPYYDVALKEARLADIQGFESFEFEELDLADTEGMERVFNAWKPNVVVNLAAQAGVRYSIDHPHDYVDTNVKGFLNVLEGCRHNAVKHLVFASSSSVYGANTTVPFAVSQNVDHPISLYAATKKANELMAHSYSHLYRLPCTGLRFFTVYGPWGRPDMAYFKFTKKIYDGEPIDIYNDGDMLRDFTYIDDIVQSMLGLMDHIPQSSADWDSDNPDPSYSTAPYRLYNIGNNRPEPLMDLIKFLEEETGIEAQKNFMPMQPGDVYATCADTDALAKDIGFRPSTSLQDGIHQFMEWYKAFYNVDTQKAAE